VSYTNLRLRVDDFLFEKSIPFSNRIQNRSVQSVIYQPSCTRRISNSVTELKTAQSRVSYTNLRVRVVGFRSKAYSVIEFKTAQSRVSYTNLRLRVVGFPSKAIQSQNSKTFAYASLAPRQGSEFSNRIKNRSVQSVIYQPSFTRRISNSVTEFKTAQSRVSYTNLRLRVDDFPFKKSIPFSNRIQNRSVQSVIYQPSLAR
jgi:hypothetical protein